MPAPAAAAAIGRSAKSALAALEQFRKKPMMKIGELTEKTGLSGPTATSAVNRLAGLGILKPLSEKKWGQVYVYADYVRALSMS